MGEARGEVKGAIQAPALIFFQNDIDDARHAFCFITRRRVGNHFDTVDQVGWYLAQAIRIADADQARRLTINQDAHPAAAPQADVAIQVYRHGRHVVQDICRAAASISQVFAYVEHPFVQRKLYLAFFSPYFHLQ